MSEEAKRIMSYMLRELSNMKYGYIGIVEGAFDTAINYYKMTIPIE